MRTKSYDLPSEMVVHALRLAEIKRPWWYLWRRRIKPVKISAGAMNRHNRNCQCLIDPAYCPVHNSR